MRYIIDRIEGNIAICEMEDKKMIEIPLASLYKDAKEGDCIIATANGQFQYDAVTTRLRREKVKQLMSSLFE